MIGFRFLGIAHSRAFIAIQHLAPRRAFSTDQLSLPSHFFKSNHHYVPPQCVGRRSSGSSYGGCAVVVKRWYSHSIPFNLADIGEGISEVEVLKWFVKEGDNVRQFDPICDVQSDKATVTISSRYDGMITKIYQKVGQMAKVGSPLCDISFLETTNAATAEPTKDGKGEERAKATYTTPSSPTTTTTTSIKSEVAEQEPPLTNSISTTKGPRKVLASPAVRFLAKKNKVSIESLPGTGKDGRVTKGDLLQLLQQKEKQVELKSTAPTTTTPTSLPPPLPPPIVPGLEIKEVVTLRGYPRSMAVSMSQSLSIPHLGYCDDIKMDKLMEFRESLKPMAEARGIKMSFMPFIIKAVSLAMKTYPLINSRINNELTEVSLISNHNIAIAVATHHGLVVPNISRVENLSLLEIAQKLAQLIEKSHNNKLTPQDLNNSTISISNIGILGGTYTSPVIVPPQVCIGAFGKVQKLPRFNSRNEVVAVHLMNISWSADHRVIDGATIANFSNLFKSYLEEPMTMLLDTK